MASKTAIGSPKSNIPPGVAGAVAAAVVAPDKTRPGKTISVGGVRTVRYYRLTRHELDFVAEPRKDAVRAFTIGGFCLGLCLNTAATLTLSKPESPVFTGMWIAVALGSAVITTVQFVRGFRQNS